MTYRKKLIEVALPLDAVNRESAREKSIRHGHPSTLHPWWARRPLAACRAVLFASLVDDPSNDLPEEKAAEERERLFRIIEELVKWENTNNEVVLKAARNEILRSTKGNPPPVLDPFCGGGSIPLEAQRLGLEAYASDLNPVAVLITKALVEIPPRFVGNPPVNPDAKKGTASTAAWKGASGLAADVRYYGKWMRDEAWKRIGNLYPKGTNGETIIAWLWARTVKCPNPACGVQMPLMRSFWLSTRRGKEVWINPIIDQQGKAFEFEIRMGKGNPPEETVDRAIGRCLVCGGLAPAPYVRSEADEDRMPHMLEAIVYRDKSVNGRRYRIPTSDDLRGIQEASELINNMGDRQSATLSVIPNEPCKGTFASNAQGATYGFFSFQDYFTERQLAAIVTFVSMVDEVRNHVVKVGGNEDYANAVATYLALGVSRATNQWSSLVSWNVSVESIRNTFARQAVPMVWDFAETNPFSESSGNWMSTIDGIAEVIDNLPVIPTNASVFQLDTAETLPPIDQALIITDPPYYDNVMYADLSDYFYVWLRRMLNRMYPDIFSTVLAPKDQEIVANRYRFNGDQTNAEQHFESRLSKSFGQINQHVNPEYPFTLYYAFKQEEEHDLLGSVPTSTGWETMLKGLIDSGFQITGTWPMRTERTGRMVSIGTNALASSIVLVCRTRSRDAAIATRREFLSVLKRELPKELEVLTNGRVAPVDLAQAVIGPGIAVFSRYSKVIEADGSAMTVRTALQEINYFLEDFLAQQEGDMDVESQFCIAWFQQYGAKEGTYGEADVLARAKNVSVEGLSRLGLVDAARGEVRLTLREDYEDGWDPGTRQKITAWEACQRLVWSLSENGERETGRLARRLGGKAEEARQLAYRLYGIADRKGWAGDALGYNALVASWPEIQKAAAAAAEESQGRMI